MPRNVKRRVSIARKWLRALFGTAAAVLLMAAYLVTRNKASIALLFQFRLFRKEIKDMVNKAAKEAGKDMISIQRQVIVRYALGLGAKKMQRVLTGCTSQWCYGTNRWLPLVYKSAAGIDFEMARIRCTRYAQDRARRQLMEMAGSRGLLPTTTHLYHEMGNPESRKVGMYADLKQVSA